MVRLHMFCLCVCVCFFLGGGVVFLSTKSKIAMPCVKNMFVCNYLRSNNKTRNYRDVMLDLSQESISR